MTVAVVGKSSFLAGALASLADCRSWLYLSHREALSDDAWTKKASVVLNCALSPALKTGAYDRAQDIDSNLAQQVAGTDVHYILHSSRTVYGPGDGSSGFQERLPARPATPYAKAKHEIEKSLVDILGMDRLTILRLANVFGHEYGRSSFFGMALTNLKRRSKIIFDMSPSVRRDFIASWRCAEVLHRVAERPQGGIYNLGAGFGTECGQIASWLMEGFGSGELEVIDHSMKDPFWLDMRKTVETYGIKPYTAEQLRDDCRSCGAFLKTAV